MKAGLLILFLYPMSLLAILPLPYPVEPWAGKESGLEEPARDPKSVQGYHELFSAGQLREMELPSFDNPPDTLGYKRDETFTVPAELKSRVEFWKKIYSEYTTSQAVMHDSEYPDIVYGVIDISKFEKDPSLVYRKKQKLIHRLLKNEKDKIVSALMSLHVLRNNPLKIPIESFAIFKKFAGIRDDDKFLTATQRVRAQRGQRDRVVEGFLHGGRYFKKMMEIFERKRIPKELTRLPIVESSFNLAARSKVGASGVWQFMRSTGKRYLQIDRAVDERNDPIAATHAAADLLRHNYEALGSWPLAITAYNHGKEGMAKAVRVLASTDLHHIIRRYKSKTFGFASSNFFSEFLAILEVEREYRKYFGKLMVDSPIQYEELPLTRDVSFSDIADACMISEKDLAILNPALTDSVLSNRVPVPRGYFLNIPPDREGKCKSGFRNVSTAGGDPARSAGAEALEPLEAFSRRPPSRLARKT